MIRSIEAVVLRYALFVVTHAGIDGSRMDSAFLEVGYLIAHQRNKRRDDEAQPFIGIILRHDKGRYLKTDTLASTGRHQRERIPSV